MNRILSDQNRLSITHPEIAAQWHPTKNGSLTPDDVSFGSNRKVWWVCSVAGDHEWEAMVCNRVNGRGCSCCRGFTIVSSNCLATTHPELVLEWYQDKNGTLTPGDVSYASHKKVWWKCSVDGDHEWETSIATRTVSGCGCPYCVGIKLIESNCLSVVYPKIAAQWHMTKNRDLTPADVTYGSGRKVWWQCFAAEDHEWEATVFDRTNRRLGCLCCSGRKVVKSNCLMTTHPDVAFQWHPSKNGSLTPDNVTAGSNKRVWWKCSVADDHEWEAKINSRTSNGLGCPCCSGQKVVLSNCLVTTHPELAIQWHTTKNGSLTPYDVTFGVRVKVWWQCSVASDHEWEAVVGNRTVLGTGCPCCAGRKVVVSNCLVVTHPGLVKEWHPDKNGLLIPSDVNFGSSKRVWWQCLAVADHEWESLISARTNMDSGCPHCSESKGEKAIALVLSQMGYQFNREVQFETCRYRYRLFFDFLVWFPDKSYILIEYQGKHHYEPQCWWSSKTDEEADIDFEEIQKRDYIKEQWARDNGVPLLVIPYWDKDRIEILIEDFIREETSETYQDGLQPQA